MYNVKDQLHHKLVDYVVKLSRRLTVQSKEKINHEINLALAELSQIFEYDSAYIFRYSKKLRGFHRIFRWAEDDINNIYPGSKGIYRAEFLWKSDIFKDGRVIAIPSVADMPDETGKLKEFLIKDNIVSATLIPISTDISPYGVIILSSSSKNISPGEQESDLLSIVGALLGNNLIRQQYNQKYKKVLKKLNTITSSMSDFICQTDTEYKVRYLSPSVKKFLGYKPVDLIGKSIYEYIHPEDKKDVEILDLFILDKKKRESRLDCRLKNKDGEYIWVEGISEFIYEDGEVTGIIMNIRNISKRKQLEAQLKSNNKKMEEMTEKLRISNENLLESQKLFRINFEEANIGMIITDLKENKYKVNDAMVKILGYSKEELRNMCVYNITHPDDVENEKEIFNQIYRGKMDSANYEKRYFHKNGDLVWANLNVVLIRGNDGENMYLLTHVEDISDIKRQEEIILRQKEEIEFNLLKTQFFANLSHELKTPLNLVFSALQILTRSLHKNDLYQDDRYLNIIRQNSMRLLRLVNNVIDMTKINVNSFELNFSLYNII
ncbi:MAG: PAS domain S-box protein, partial [Halanaerobiales bacterium]